jgi:regulator of replication initiation timing
MYFALGLLAAGLVVLVIMPAVWRRAVRLTRARVEASLPMTLAEIEADKDQLRANFAVANRKLELEAETLRGRLAEDTVARGRSRDEVSALTRAKAALGETVAALEERVAELSGALATTENKLATATTEIAVRDRAMSDLDNHLADLRAELAAAQVGSEEQRVEMVARNTEVANIADRLKAAAATQAQAETERDRLATELSMERDRLYAEQKRADGLAAGLAALESERISRLAELERAAGDRRTLESNLAAERQRTVAITRELEAGRSMNGANSAAAAELDQLRQALAAAERDRTDLLNRLSVENSLLRERLGEVAASVARIGQASDSKAPLPVEPAPLRSTPAAPPSPATDEPAIGDFPLATGTRH